MKQDEIRQLIRIRHELRRLEPERDQSAASRLLSLMRATIARDPGARAAVEREIERWQVAFQLPAL